jgi:hypothetical protein
MNIPQSKPPASVASPKIKKKIQPSQAINNAVAIAQLDKPIKSANPKKTIVKKIQDVLDSTNVRKHRTRIERLILIALSNALEYQKQPHKTYNGKKLTKANFGTARPKGAHQKELIRFHLICTLFWAWRTEFKLEPTINRKITKKTRDTIRSPFVVFAGEMLQIAGIGKPEEHLASYRSYEKAFRRGRTYEQWKEMREKQIQAKKGIKKTK